MKRTLLAAALAGAVAVSCSEDLKAPPPDSLVGQSIYQPPIFTPVRVTAGEPPPNLFDGWARDRDDLWYAGEDELVLHWDGAAWVRAPEADEADGLDPAHDCQPCTVGAGGSSATCLPPPPDGPPPMGGSGGGGAGGSGGTGGAGGSGELVDVGPPDLHGIWAHELPKPPPPDGQMDDGTPPPLELFAAGGKGTVLHGRRGWWAREPVVVRAVPADPASAYRVYDDLEDVDGDGDSVVVVGHGGLVAWRNPELCRFEVQARVTRENLNAVLLRGGDLVAVGNLGAMVTQSAGADPVRFRVAGLVAPLRGLWGTVDRFYAVGLDGKVLSSTGFPDLSVTEITGAPRVYLRDVWGLSPGDVYIVGWNGTIVHFDGQEMRELLDPETGGRFTDQRLESVLGFQRPPLPDRKPDDPPPPEPPPGALITGARPVYVGGVTSTILQGP